MSLISYGDDFGVTTDAKGRLASFLARNVGAAAAMVTV